MNTDMIARDTDRFASCEISEGALELARADLIAHGVTEDQWSQVTGFGSRRLGFCRPDDTILNKYACGALSMMGVMGAVFGSNSPQHKRGTNA